MVGQAREALLPYENILYDLMADPRCASVRYDLDAARQSLHAARTVAMVAAERLRALSLAPP